MWFKALDQKQFTLYAQQSARLNTAYWLATLIVYKCEENVPSDIAHAEIESFKRQIALMFQHIRKDVRRQKGLPQQLVRHELAYIAGYCRQSTKNTNKRFLYSRIGMPIAGDELMADKEIEFIRDRSNILNDDDLLEQWDRGIYLTYEAIRLKEQSRFTGRRRIIKNFEAAESLMTPTPMVRLNYCRAYVDQLGLDAPIASDLLDRLLNDVTNMYAAGADLVKFSRQALLGRERILASVVDRSRVQRESEELADLGADIQKNLIMTNLARTDTIRRVIDNHVVD